MRLTEIDHFLIDTSKGTFWNHSLGVMQATICAPHLAANTNHGRHRGIHDHITWRMQVGNALSGVDHRQSGTMLVASVQILNDFFTLRLWQGFDLVVEATHTVVGIHTQLFKQLSMFFKSIFVEDLHSVPEHDRM